MEVRAAPELAGGYDGFTEADGSLRESPADGAERSAVPGSLGLRPSSGDLGFSRMDVVVLRVLSWVRSSGFMAGGRAAQEKKVIAATTSMVCHFQFFICIILLFR